jgi:hypothetical protein
VLDALNIRRFINGGESKVLAKTSVRKASVRKRAKSVSSKKRRRR